MRILYVSFDNPAVDTILKGMHDEDLWGLPAMYYPFKELLERGHTVDLMLFSFSCPEVTESDHFKKRNLIYKQIKRYGIMSSIVGAVNMIKAVERQLHKKKYDFVYGMGEGTDPAVCVAEHMGIPCALRQFGVQEMTNRLEAINAMVKRQLVAITQYPYITLSLAHKKSFLLATNDGSRANKLFELLKIKRKPYNYYFWRSGVMIPKQNPSVDVETTGVFPEEYDPMALSMIGRIDSVKRQDRAVRILAELHKKGMPMRLYLVGDDDAGVRAGSMFQETAKTIQSYGLDDYVFFTGKKTQLECRQFARNACATLLVSEWNRVNIFYEVMSEGSLVITNDNHSIDEFIKDGDNCIVYEEENYSQAAEKLMAILSSTEQLKRIRYNAYKTAVDSFLNAEKRFGTEVDLIEGAVNNRDLSNYPEIV